MCKLPNALDHAHALGVAYRDLKPANVLLGEAGAFYLSDLGFAPYFAPMGTKKTVGTTQTAGMLTTTL